MVVLGGLCAVVAAAAAWVAQPQPQPHPLHLCRHQRAGAFCAAESSDEASRKTELAAAFRKFEKRYSALKAGDDEPGDDAVSEALQTFESKFQALKKQKVAEPEVDTHEELMEAFAKFEANVEALEEEREEQQLERELQRQAIEAEPRVASWSRGIGPCRLFVGGIPFGMKEADVARLFDGVALPHEISPVLEVSLVLGRDGASKGFGFVELATVAQAKRAMVLLNGRAVGYGGRLPTTLAVRQAEPPRGPKPSAVTAPMAGRLLWVGNLSWSVKPQDVRDAFAAAAGLEPLTSGVWCHVPRDNAGRSLGFCTVRFPNTLSAARALAAMTAVELGGRSILVKFDERAGPPPAIATDHFDDVPPAADAIDPDLLADVESRLMVEEMETRKADDDVRREQEIARHRLYLSAVAAAEQRAKQAAEQAAKTKAKAKLRSRARQATTAAASSPHRVCTCTCMHVHMHARVPHTSTLTSHRSPITLTGGHLQPTVRQARRRHTPRALRASRG